MSTKSSRFQQLDGMTRLEVSDGETSGVPEHDRWLVDEVLRLRLRGRSEASFLAQGEEGLIRVWAARSSNATVSISYAATAAPFGLTLRQLEVLTGVACGMTNPVIAEHLHLAVKTVAKHVEHLLLALGCSSRVELAVIAVRRRLVFLPRPAVRREFTDHVRRRLINAVDDDALAAPARRRPITCVAVYPLDDPEGNALAMQNGARLAIDRFNATGGIGDRVLRFEALETAEPRDGVLRALGAGADAILLGNFPYEPALAAIEAAKGAGVPVLHCMITPQLSETVQAESGLENIFQVCGVETAYSLSFGRTLVSLMRERGQNSGAVSLVLRPHMLEPASLASIETQLAGHGIHIHSLLSTLDLEQAPETALKLLDGTPDAVHISILPEALMRSILPFIRSERTLAFADWSPSSPFFLKRMGREAEGLHWSTIVGAGDGSRYRRFRDAYSARFGTDPGMSVAAVHFDIVQLLAHAWRESERPWDFSVVRKALSREVFRGLAGPYWLGGPGQRGLVHSVDTPDASVALPIRSYQVRDGKHRPLDLRAA